MEKFENHVFRRVLDVRTRIPPDSARYNCWRLWTPEQHVHFVHSNTVFNNEAPENNAAPSCLSQRLFQHRYNVVISYLQEAAAHQHQNGEQQHCRHAEPKWPRCTAALTSFRTLCLRLITASAFSQRFSFVQPRLQPDVGFYAKLEFGN